MRTACWLILAVHLAATPAVAAPVWRPLPLYEGFGRVEDVHFLDANHGWVVRAGGQVLRTTNGGASWTLQYENQFHYFRSVRFADLNRGWFGSLSSNALLHKTTDGGATWTLVEGIPEPRPNAICGISVPNSQTIYAVGSYGTPARIIKSSDGGVTWTSRDLWPLARTAVDVFFRSANEGFVVGSVGSFPAQSRAVVLHTTDGGATWTQRYVGEHLGEWGWKISSPPQTPWVMFVSLERPRGPMHLIKSLDAGYSWFEIPFQNENEQGIGFVTPTIGWIGGHDNPTYGTTNGGATWTMTPWGADLNRFQFLSTSLGYAGGETVYKYSELPVAAVEPSAPRPGARAMPNPFLSRTVIRFALERAERVQLFVADLTGRVVRTLEEGERGAGEHVVTWDGRDDRGVETPPGFYLYVLHAGERHEMGKLVRVR